MSQTFSLFKFRYHLSFAGVAIGALTLPRTRQPRRGVRGKRSPVLASVAQIARTGRQSRVLSQWFATQFPRGASPPRGLLLALILPVSSLVAPCDPGAAPDLCHDPLGQDTSRWT
jgi:hypothetical protein